MKQLATISNTTIEAFKLLSEDESDLIISHMDNVALFQTRIRQAQQIVQIFREIQKSLSGNSNEKIYRLIGELLSGFRAFLDYWETNLKREFGKDSSQANDFKQSTNNEYDNVFAYRFICELRNYVQHCGMPEILKKSKLDNNSIRTDYLILNSVELLNSFKWKSKVRHDLESKDNALDLLVIFPILMKSVNRINNSAVNLIDVQSVLTSCRKLIEYEKYKVGDSKLAIIEFSQESPTKIDGIDVKEFPFEVARNFISNIK
jgi:hypothetical protein